MPNNDTPTPRRKAAAYRTCRHAERVFLGLLADASRAL